MKNEFKPISCEIIKLQLQSLKRNIKKVSEAGKNRSYIFENYEEAAN